MMTGQQILNAREEAIAFMESLEPKPHHVRQVSLLAVTIFDAIPQLHGLGELERFYLEAAGLLHDIGWSVATDGAKHHKHSARLIRENSWRHLQEHHIEIIAQVARYHRKSIPKKEHEDFQSLLREEQKLVESLAAILRVADGLDRSHRQRVQAIQVKVDANDIIFVLKTSEPVKPEIMAAQKKSDLAKKVFKRQLIFEVVPI